MEGTLFSWEWWVSAVVVGIVINVFSAYLKPLIDGAGSRVSKGWAGRSRARREAFEAEVATLALNPDEAAFCFQMEVRLYFYMLLYIIMSAVFLIALTQFESLAEKIGKWFVFAVVVFVMFTLAMSMTCNYFARRAALLLREARKLRLKRASVK